MDTVVLLLVELIGYVVISLTCCCFPNDGQAPQIFFPKTATGHRGLASSDTPLKELAMLPKLPSWSKGADSGSPILSSLGLTLGLVSFASVVTKTWLWLGWPQIILCWIDKPLQGLESARFNIPLDTVWVISGTIYMFCKELMTQFREDNTLVCTE